MKYLSVILIPFLFGTTYAQETLIQDEYYLNPFIINPAAAGMEDYRVINATTKNQWLGVKDAPGVQMLSINSRIGNYDFYTPKMMLNKSNVITKNRVGLGACLFNDHNGPLSFQGLLLSYAYHVPFRFSRLSFGLSASITRHRLDQTKFEPYYPDAYLSMNVEKIYYPGFSFGAVYHSHKYYLGLSGSHPISFENSLNSYAEAKADYYLIGSYKFHDLGRFDVEPSAMVKLEDYETVYFDIHTKINVFDFYWFSLSYRSYNAIAFNLGLKLLRNTYVSYGFETNVGEVVEYFTGTHQIGIGVNTGLRAVQGVRKYVKE